MDTYHQRLSRFPLFTQKQTPAEAFLQSHRLMIRAGIIDRLSSGLYSLLPCGLRVIHNISRIVREEMDACGAFEILMPIVQPAELWKSSGRLTQFGNELLQCQDRHGHDCVLAPTHEEVVCDIIKRRLTSYRSLPFTYYQIQTKFRDEIRPRFGLMRAREFIMKDAYSFHDNSGCLDRTYKTMQRCYESIFTRIGLDTRMIEADSGNIGGSSSHEFHVICDCGEDTIVISDADDAAYNLEVAKTTKLHRGRTTASMERMRSLATPGVKTINDLAKFLGKEPQYLIKTIVVRGCDGGWVIILLRGNHQLNPLKAAHHPLIADPFEMAKDTDIHKTFGCSPGSLGPVGVKLPVVADYAVYSISNMVVGANREGQHLAGVNWKRDLCEPPYADLRFIEAGDPSPSGRGKVIIKRGIEIGHTFKLGNKYSKSAQLSMLDGQGKPFFPLMGCYGIGVSRIMAACVENSHDQQGIIWPPSIAPFQVHIVAIGYGKNENVTKTCEHLLAKLRENHIETLIDDRDLRGGEKFADSDLLGLPIRLLVSARSLEKDSVEIKPRCSDKSELVKTIDAIQTITTQLKTMT